MLATVGEPAASWTDRDGRRPDIAIIASDTGALDAAAEIRRDGTPVLVVARQPAGHRLAQLLRDRRGGFGYLVWDRIESVRAFTSAVETVATGGVVTAAAALATVLSPYGGLEALTPRERQVLALLARGLSNRAIADELTVTLTSVEKHIKRVLSKLDLRDTGRTHRRVLAALAFHSR